MIRLQGARLLLRKIVPLSRCALPAIVWLFAMAATAPAQVIITEIMFNPAGDEDAWEWVEVRNTGAATVNLNGWVFGDRASRFAAANISSSLGNTLIAPGTVAVIYPSAAMGSGAEQRFVAAWGSSITLIPTSVFPSLNNSGGERIGLWSSYSSYFVDAMSEPNWNQSVFNLDIAAANGFPGVSGVGGPSIAWTGSCSVTNGSNWEVSEAGTAGARQSNHTLFPATQINSNLDRGNPGVVLGGTLPSGLKITEIMFNPASPAVNDDFSDDDFEWIEVLNNTGAAIDFASTKYLLDDNDGNDLTATNVTSGGIANGQTGVLFNAQKITAAEMKTAWGNSINFIPVTNWPTLNNTGGDSIGLWASLSAYQSEPTTGSGRTHANAAAAIVYDEGGAWPSSDNRSSIYLNSYSSNPILGTSWKRSGELDGNLSSVTAAPIIRQTTDNPGTDVGSPGLFPGAPASLPGDYNNDHIVNAADYTVWRNRLNQSFVLPNDLTPGAVTFEDYGVWKNNFGHVLAGGAGYDRDAIPEPTNAFIALTAIAAALAVNPRRRPPALR